MAFFHYASLLSIGFGSFLESQAWASRQHEKALQETLAPLVEAAKQSPIEETSSGLNLVLKAADYPLPSNLTYSVSPLVKSTVAPSSDDQGIEPGIYQIAVQENGRDIFSKEFLAMAGLKSNLELRYTKDKEFVMKQTLDLPQIKFLPFQKLLAKPSFALLKNVVKILNQHPEIELLVFEVHTDAAGDPERNQELTDARAIVVRNYLVKNGIDAQRIRAQGLGSTQAIASNETKEGRLQNRRVEYRIEEISAAPKLLGDR